MNKKILLSPDAADGGNSAPPPPEPTAQDFRDLVKRVDALEALVNPKWQAEK